MAQKNGHATPGASWRDNYVPAYISSGQKQQALQSQVEVASMESSSSVPDRGRWASKWEFIFSCIGLSVGIGNVWRFPYLAYDNGGGAFLIPYVIVLILVGKPMYLMETAIGQYSQKGPISMWSMAPIMKDFFADEKCFVRNASFPACKFLLKRNITNFTAGEDCHLKTELAAEQYFRHYVLQESDNGLDAAGEVGNFNWQLTLCLLLSWIIVFLCLMKGVKSSGKAVYVTATAPYLFLIAILIYGCTLPGAIEGVKFFFIPEWEKLKDINVWQRAAEQVFFSLSVSWGPLITFGSYNAFNNKVHIDSMVISSLDFVTSLIASVAIFSIMGSLAQSAGVKVDQVVESGQGLAFIAFPEAIGAAPGWQLWSILFFIMLYTLGLDSEFALLETGLTALYDALPATRSHKVKVTLLATICCFLLGLPCVSQAGPYVVKLMDTFGGLCVMVIAVFELIGIMWVYGVRRFCDNVEFMIGYKPTMFFKVCWVLVSPLLLTAIFCYAMYEYKAPTYGEYSFPAWALGVGWMLAAISVIQIPIWGIVILVYYYSKGNTGQAFRPLPSWGPGDLEARQRLLAVQQKILKRDQLQGRDNPALELERV